MRKLIAEDQIPAAELNLALANLSEKRIARVSAEQGLREVRLALARQIGLAPEQAAALARPAQALPATDAAAVALRRAAEQLAEGAESVRRYATTLENAQTKRRLGSATLIDVIDVEDRLSNALAAEVSLRQGYANAIARLRFEIGALVRREGERFVVRVADLESASFEQELR